MWKGGSSIRSHSSAQHAAVADGSTAGAQVSGHSDVAFEHAELCFRSMHISIIYQEICCVAMEWKFRQQPVHHDPLIHGLAGEKATSCGFTLLCCHLELAADESANNIWRT